MTFRQGWPLWVLIAALIPIIIHMLNRLRYKTVQWAAMLFLLKANKSATRRAKLRQYLLLLFRALVIFFMIFAMLRPVTGGWLGAAAGGAPEVILVLLDRSASMEARAGAEMQVTKRQHAISLLTEAAKNNKSSRFVLIESALRQPTEMADMTALASIQAGEPTDTAADIPAMLRTALDYLVKNKAGSWEIWIASDLQASNWRPESQEWKDISARFEGVGESFIRVVDLSSPLQNNLSIAVKSADFRPAKEEKDKGTLALAMEVKSTGAASKVPMKITQDGATNEKDLLLDSALKREVMKLNVLKLPDGGGWGKLELPTDDLSSDNVAYFTYRREIPLYAAIVGDGIASRVLSIASAPDKTNENRTAEILSVSRAAEINWKNAAMIAWTGEAPSEAVAAKLKEFVESGGVLIAFPPGGDAKKGPMDIQWGSMENAAEPLRVASWDELDGPFAKTDSGTSLPLSNLEMIRRQIPRIGENQHVYGLFADSQPFFVGQRVGAGAVFACATLPDREWSTLGEGIVILPMIQRLLEQGGARLAPPALATAGEWKPSEGEFWTALETDRRRDARWSSGIFKNGDRLIALNRPEIEDAPDATNEEALKTLLPRVKLNMMSDALALKADRLESEVWPLMIIATMIFMILEMLLATSKAFMPKQTQPAPAPAKREEVAA